MQRKKTLVKNLILKTAEDEFCLKGYMHTSIRGIAKRAGVSAANMYNYFRSKDELFEAVLNPVLSDIEKGKSFLESPRAAEEIYDLDDHLKMITSVIEYVEKNRNIFKLLFFNSAGSVYEDYIDGITEWYTDMTAGFLPWMSAHLNVDEISVDRFVLHNISGIWIQFFREALMHGTEGDEFVDSARKVMTFSYKGWKGLFKYKVLV